MHKCEGGKHDYVPNSFVTINQPELKLQLTNIFYQFKIPIRCDSNEEARADIQNFFTKN